MLKSRGGEGKGGIYITTQLSCWKKQIRMCMEWCTYMKKVKFLGKEGLGHNI